MVIEVLILGSEAPLFEGKAGRVILPGEQGVFEVGPLHRPLISRLLPGTVIVDEQAIPIRRGVAQVGRNRMIALVEPA